MKRRNSRVRSLGATLAPLLAAWACAGCGPRTDEGKINFYLPRPQDLTRIGRVAMVELSYDGHHPGLQRGVTDALVTAIRDKSLFHLEVVRSDDPRLEQLPAGLHRRSSYQDLAAVRKTLGCDALLIGSIQRFEPYPRMQVGLLLRLLDLKNGRLVWGLEHTWDTSDQATELRIREFFRSRMRRDYDPLDWRLALVSPRAFHKYVACEVAGTLEAKPPPAEQSTSADVADSRQTSEGLRKSSSCPSGQRQSMWQNQLSGE